MYVISPLEIISAAVNISIPPETISSLGSLAKYADAAKSIAARNSTIIMYRCISL